MTNVLVASWLETTLTDKHLDFLEDQYVIYTGGQVYYLCLPIVYRKGEDGVIWATKSFHLIPDMVLDTIRTINKECAAKIDAVDQRSNAVNKV